MGAYNSVVNININRGEAIGFPSLATSKLQKDRRGGTGWRRNGVGRCSEFAKLTKVCRVPGAIMARN